MTDLFKAEPIPAEAAESIRALMESGDLFRYTASRDNPAPVTLLEQEFAAYLGARYALALNSCSSAIFLALRALGLEAGDKVLIPAFTFAAVPSALVHAGVVPVLVEVDDSLRINLEDFHAKMSGDIAAVVISHMRGHTSDMDAIGAACDSAGIPLIEDAAHSLGTLWHGRKLGTLGAVGCFSFQSYKMVNGGEGGVLLTDDPEIIAQAAIMSGAYELNWDKHLYPEVPFEKYQNTLPLYNLRMNNLSAAVIRPQIPLIDQRVRQGAENHDHVAERLNASPWLSVPPALGPEQRAPDSIQFNLIGFSDDEARALMAASKARGMPVSIFGLHGDNARVFWNWKFLGDAPDLPKTRAMLMRACDVRLPVQLTRAQLDHIADAILGSVADIKGSIAAQAAE